MFHIFTRQGRLAFVQEFSTQQEAENFIHDFFLETGHGADLEVHPMYQIAPFFPIVDFRKK